MTIVVVDFFPGVRKNVAMYHSDLDSGGKYIVHNIGLFVINIMMIILILTHPSCHNATCYLVT